MKRKWVCLEVIGIVLFVTLHLQHYANAADPRMEEIIDVLKSSIENIEKSQYGAVSADLDYANQLWSEQKGILLSGCIVKTVPAWSSEKEPTIQTAGAAAFGGGTTIEQKLLNKSHSLKIQILVSPVASGLGALFSNPALLGAGKGRVRRFGDGVTAHVESDKITAKVGNAVVTWAGKLAPQALWQIADQSVDRDCVKDLS
ncbi:MAG: hypothetical protein NPIRA04_22640 [Nitrospirales bacterium]|nr:MAG: hypothetical protein NPIRA04_22640 [Nitrospirales bacterium]